MFKTETIQQEMSQQSKMRCQVCRHKIVFELKCTCGKVCCVACRLPEVHQCTAEVKKIELDKVVADKMKDKI